MTQHGKKYKESRPRPTAKSMHGVAEAVDLVKQLASAKFDETVELAVRLGVHPQGRPDRPRHAVAPLGDRPHPTGGGLRRR